MGNIFSTDGFLWRAMRDLTSLVVINLITIVCSLPIVTAGAAVASMHYVLYQMIEDQEGHIVPSYLKQFRGNLRSATPLWLIMLVSGGILLFEYSAFKEQGGAGRIVIIFVYAGALFLAMLGVWLFPLTAKFVYTTAGCFILTHDLRLAPLALLIGISLPSYFCALIYHPVFDEMIRKRQKMEGEDIIDEKGEGIDPEKEE